jgi:flagellar motor switch protein FliN/FliY
MSENDMMDGTGEIPAGAENTETENEETTQPIYSGAFDNDEYAAADDIVPEPESEPAPEPEAESEPEPAPEQAQPEEDTQPDASASPFADLPPISDSPIIPPISELPIIPPISELPSIPEFPETKKEPAAAPVVDVHPMQYANFDDEDAGAHSDKNSMELVYDIPLQVAVELGKTHKEISEILEFGMGTIIVLDKLAGDPVEVLANGKLIARGEVVVIDENYGVRITEIVNGK